MIEISKREGEEKHMGGWRRDEMWNNRKTNGYLVQIINKREDNLVVGSISSSSTS